MHKQNIDADRLPRSVLFQDIPKAQALEIIKAGSWSSLQKDGILFHQGDRAEECYFLLSGQLKLTKLHQDGREVVLRYVGSGGLSAAAALLRENPYPVTALVLCQTAVISWGKDMLLKFMQQYPQLAINILSIVLERLEEMQQRFLQISSEQTERRLARALLGIMQHAGTKTTQGIIIDLELSREDLANFIGTTHYTVSRILSDWTRKGWIATYRRQIIVQDAHALRLRTESLF